MERVLSFEGVQGESRSVRWAQPVTFHMPRGAMHVIRTNSVLSAPLFRLCLGFSEPNGGRVAVHGLEPAGLERKEVRDLRRKLGCALEPDGLVANLSIRMNLIVPLVFATEMQYEDAATRADNLLSVMHLSMWADSRPASLPAEVRQIAALARAVSSRPSLLLLENPLASVDAREARRLIALCRQQAETVLIATHRYDGVLHHSAEAVWEWDAEGFREVAA